MAGMPRLSADNPSGRSIQVNQQIYTFGIEIGAPKSPNGTHKETNKSCRICSTIPYSVIPCSLT